MSDRLKCFRDFTEVFGGISMWTEKDVIMIKTLETEKENI